MENTATPPTPPQAAPAAVEELIDITDFAKVKLKVALVESAEAVPNSQKLLKLSVNLGETLGKRQVIAGIAKMITPEALVGRKVVIVANLKPAKLMGLESQGMILAVGDKEALGLLQPDCDVPLGSTVR